MGIPAILAPTLVIPPDVQPVAYTESATVLDTESEPLVEVLFTPPQLPFHGWRNCFAETGMDVTVAATNSIGATTVMFPTISAIRALTKVNGAETATLAGAIPVNADCRTSILQLEIT